MDQVKLTMCLVRQDSDSRHKILQRDERRTLESYYPLVNERHYNGLLPLRLR